MSLLELVANISKSHELKEKVDPILEDVNPKSRVTILAGLMHENIMKLDVDERRKVTARVITTMMEIVYMGE